MLDPKLLTEMIEKQIADSVNDQVLEVFSSTDWIEPLEQKILDYTQDRILKKFANSSTMPEIIDAVKQSVAQLFADGNLPGIENFVDSSQIESSVNSAIENTVKNSVIKLEQNPQWIEKVETLISQVVVNRVLTAMSTVDVNSVIRKRVDENLDRLRDQVIDKITLKGIQNAANQVELTILDEHVVVENQLTSKNIEVVDTASIRNLSVTGSVNVDNPSWQSLKNEIALNTEKLLTSEWKKKLIQELSEEIKKNNIDFAHVSINGDPLVNNGVLSNNITSSNIQELGTLKKLRVSGESHLYDTFSVVNKRVGVNTPEPEMALGVWDEEVSILVGKYKNKTGYIGTGRLQNLAIGINRDSAIEIDINGVTAVKKLQVGVNRIAHNKEVPGWSGSKGDIVFNNNITNENNVFAWICLGEYKWKSLRSL